MSFKRLIVLAAIGLLSLGANAAQIIVPAAGAGAGAAGSNWQSDLLLHNVAPRAIAFDLSFHAGTTVYGPIEVNIPARNTVQMLDVAKSVFGFNNGTGALVVDLEDRDVKYLALTSRTYNVSKDAEYGQNIPAVRAADAAAAGDIAVLTNPGAGQSIIRFNIGLYAVENTTVQWELVRAAGDVAATKEVTYSAGEHQQYNVAVVNLFNAEPKVGDNIYARVQNGRAVVYGSQINHTGDPTFVQATHTRDEVLIRFGVDLDEDGDVDVHDADNDGVLDQPIDVYTSLFPAYFRIVAESEFGDPVTFEVVQSEADAVFRDASGTMRVGAAGDLKNKSGSIVVRATSNGTVTLLTIPVRFR